MKKLLRYTLVLVGLIQLVSCKKDSSIAIADLPAAIKTYVEANYPGYALEEAEQETLCTGESTYEVEIEQGDDDELELTFDTDGNFLFSETEIPVAELPAAVINTIASNYAGFKTEEADKLSMADGTTRYEVELEKGKTEKEVLFDAEGGVICEQDE